MVPIYIFEAPKIGAISVCVCPIKLAQIKCLNNIIVSYHKCHYQTLVFATLGVFTLLILVLKTTM